CMRNRNRNDTCGGAEPQVADDGGSARYGTAADTIAWRPDPPGQLLLDFDRPPRARLLADLRQRLRILRLGIEIAAAADDADPGDRRLGRRARSRLADGRG